MTSTRLSSSDITRLLHRIYNFAGVFASDKMPTTLPRDSFIIVNIDPVSKSGSHWVAFGHLSNPDRVPEFFDPMGLDVNQSSAILDEHTDFYNYITSNSKRYGHGGNFLSNRVDLQCVAKRGLPHRDVGESDCGRWCVLYVRLAELPTNPRTDAIRPEWRNVISFQSHCWTHSALLKKIVGA